MFFPALIAKFLSAGALAQACTGAGVALVAFTGVGAAGGLPDPVQDTFATVVAEVTPLEPPTSEEAGDETAPEKVLSETPPVTIPETETETETETGTGTGTEVGTPADAGFDVDAWITAGPEGYDSFGAWVSQSAQKPEIKAALRARGQNFGSVVSMWAHKKGMTADDLAAVGVDPDELTTAPTAPPATVVEDLPETQQPAVSAPTDDRSRGNGTAATGNGHGKSVGNGSGNGKAAGSGNGKGNGKN
jgi:hypothetical protein